MNGGSPWRLDGRTALVTGASRGIGAAIASVLADAGGRVAINATTREGEEARALAASLPGALALPLDLGPPGSGRALADAARDALGQVDILVHCAAIQIERPWHEAPPDEMDLHWSINLRETLALTQALVPAMVERRWGRVVGVASVQAFRPHPSMMVYAALKAALVNMTRNLAKQVAVHGVTANTISPGAIDTPRNAAAFADPAVMAAVAARIPTGRVGRADECAGAALLLCSDAGSYITGTDILIDGGLLL